MPASSRLLLSLLLFSLPAHTWALSLDGEFIQGGIIRGQTEPGNEVRIDGKSIRVTPAGRFIFGFGRDHKPDATLEVLSRDGKKQLKTLKVRSRDYRIQRINGLPPSKVSKFSKKALKQIRDDSAAARKARAADDPRADWDKSWIWPATGRISGVYGSQRVLNGEPKRPHFGVDVAAPVGTPVKAPADGIVTLVRDMYFSGITIILDHGHQFSSSFLHLSKAHVRVGDEVKQGAVIAEIGATGRVTGPHLDWRMNLGTERVDPQLLVPPMPKPKQ